MVTILTQSGIQNGAICKCSFKMTDRLRRSGPGTMLIGFTYIGSKSRLKTHVFDDIPAFSNPAVILSKISGL